jgi:hypothetical protein
MNLTRHVSATALPAAACFFGCVLLLGCGEASPTPDAAPPDAAPDATPIDAPVDAGPSINPCQLVIDDEARPGHPFDMQRFEADILPELQNTCARAGCHLGGGGSGYQVWFDDDSSCATVESFNSFYAHTDFKVQVANSPILRNINGSNEHPGPSNNSQIVAELRDFIQAAHVQYTGGAGPGDQTYFFDASSYATTIQPALDAAGCAGAGCHNQVNRAGGLGLHATPAAGSPELAENFKLVASYVALTTGTPEATTLYRYSVNNHGDTLLGTGDVTALAAWIDGALAQVDSAGADIAACAPATSLDLGVFADEIIPLLAGRVDYNDLDSGRTSTGCARSECHGRDRGPGTFYIDPFRAPEANLDSFRCFVNQQNPATSQALLCPLNLPGCQKAPHPGADIFFGFDDLNYQKLLSYVLAAKNAASPLDFAFFARKINPMLDDENAVQDGQLGLTCASQGCHFVMSNNGVNFGIIPGATSPEEVFLNYAEAVKFVYSPDAGQSSLLMYPTNEVANSNNAAATNQQHPGGQCFDVADQEALDIIEFAGGLRPDGQGFLHHFLVAGLLPATDVTDEPPFDEDSITPRIFERSGQSQQYNQGLWDMYSSASENIDLLQAFSVADAAGQLVLAVAYVINNTSNDLDTVITVESENDVMLLAGTAPDQVAQIIGRDGAGATLAVSLPAFESSRKLTRLVVKAYQKAGDPSFGFTIQFTDDNGNLLTNATRELVFTLGGEGGGL